MGNNDGTSLVKFFSETKGNGRGPIHWGRAGEDGAPFRGDVPTGMTEDEFSQRLAKVADSKNGTFDTSKSDENKAYLHILDKITNQWADCLFVDRRFDENTGHWLVYIEWVEYYMEDGTAAAAQSAQMSRVTNEQRLLPPPSK
jgi:hypothetical protein